MIAKTSIAAVQISIYMLINSVLLLLLLLFNKTIFCNFYHLFFLSSLHLADLNIKNFINLNVLHYSSGRAWNVIDRVRRKLKGTDFSSDAGSLPNAAAVSSSPAAVVSFAALQVVAPGSATSNVPPLAEGEQVQRLLQEAVSHVNLCQSYIGWCPFW